MQRKPETLNCRVWGFLTCRLRPKAGLQATPESLYKIPRAQLITVRFRSRSFLLYFARKDKDYTGMLMLIIQASALYSLCFRLTLHNHSCHAMFMSHLVSTRLLMTKRIFFTPRSTWPQALNSKSGYCLFLPFNPSIPSISPLGP